MRIRATRCFQTKNAQSSKQSIGVEGRVLRVIVRDVFDLQHILHVFKNHKRGNKGKKKDDGNDQRSRERARTEVSECLRWRKFRDGRRSDAKLISRLNSGFFIPPPLLAPE